MNGAGLRLTMPEFRVDPADCRAPPCVSRFCFKRLLDAPVLGANEVIFSSRSPPAFVPRQLERSWRWTVCGCEHGSSPGQYLPVLTCYEPARCFLGSAG